MSPTRSVERALKILQKGDAGLIQALESGQMKVSAGARKLQPHQSSVERGGGARDRGRGTVPVGAAGEVGRGAALHRGVGERAELEMCCYP